MDVEKLVFAVVTVPRKPQYVHQTLASLFASDRLVHDLTAIDLFVGTNDTAYLAHMRHHAEIMVHALTEEENAEIRDWTPHRKCCHTHWRCLSHPIPEEGGICVVEDDVVFRNGFIELLAATVEEMEQVHGLRDYALALTSGYDFERDRTFYRGARFCSYGYAYYGLSATRCT